MSIYMGGRMDGRQVQWEQLSPEVRSSILSPALLGLESMNAREVSNLLWSFGKLDVMWLGLPPFPRDALMAALQRETLSMTNFDLESLFVGLGLMQVRRYSCLYSFAH